MGVLDRQIELRAGAAARTILKIDDTAHFIVLPQRAESAERRGKPGRPALAQRIAVRRNDQASLIAGKMIAILAVRHCHCGSNGLIGSVATARTNSAASSAGLLRKGECELSIVSSSTPSRCTTSRLIAGGFERSAKQRI